MADKKFYYLQLESSLFSNMKMMMLDRMNNRKDLLYLLIKLSTISIENEGKLILDNEPLSIEMISFMIGESEEETEKLMNILIKLKLVSLINNVYVVDFASDRIGSITDRALRKQRELERNSSGTQAEMSGTQAEMSGTQAEKVPQCKSKSNNKSKKLDIEIKKELDIELDTDIKKEKKEENALLEKDALLVYDFYKLNVKSGGRADCIKRLQSILKKETVNNLIISIKNYLISKNGEKDIKFLKASDNFFNKLDGFYFDFLPSEFINPKMTEELNNLRSQSYLVKENGELNQVGLEMENEIKAKYGIMEDDEECITAEFKVLKGGKNV